MRRREALGETRWARCAATPPAGLALRPSLWMLWVSASVPALAAICFTAFCSACGTGRFQRSQQVVARWPGLGDVCGPRKMSLAHKRWCGRRKGLRAAVMAAEVLLAQHPKAAGAAQATGAVKAHWATGCPARRAWASRTCHKLAVKSAVVASVAEIWSASCGTVWNAGGAVPGSGPAPSSCSGFIALGCSLASQGKCCLWLELKVLTETAEDTSRGTAAHTCRQQKALAAVRLNGTESRPTGCGSRQAGTPLLNSTSAGPASQSFLAHYQAHHPRPEAKGTGQSCGAPRLRELRGL